MVEVIVSDKSPLTWRQSYEMCKQGVCKWHTFDMDGAYCAHPRSFELSPVYGYSTNRMIAEGACTGCNDDPSKNKRQLFEPIKSKE